MGGGRFESLSRPVQEEGDEKICLDDAQQAQPLALDCGSTLTLIVDPFFVLAVLVGEQLVCLTLQLFLSVLSRPGCQLAGYVSERER